MYKKANPCNEATRFWPILRCNFPQDEIEEEKEGEEKDDDGERSEMAEERGGGSLNGSRSLTPGTLNGF